MNTTVKDSFSLSNHILCLAFFCAFVTFFNTKQYILHVQLVDGEPVLAIKGKVHPCTGTEALYRLYSL